MRVHGRRRGIAKEEKGGEHVRYILAMKCRPWVQRAFAKGKDGGCKRRPRTGKDGDVILSTDIFPGEKKKQRKYLAKSKSV